MLWAQPGVVQRAATAGRGCFVRVQVELSGFTWRRLAAECACHVCASSWDLFLSSAVHYSCLQPDCVNPLFVIGWGMECCTLSCPRVCSALECQGSRSCGGSVPHRFPDAPRTCPGVCNGLACYGSSPRGGSAPHRFPDAACIMRPMHSAAVHAHQGEGWRGRHRLLAQLGPLGSGGCGKRRYCRAPKRGRSFPRACVC